MKKKLLSILLCTAMVATMLTACGGDDTTNDGGSQVETGAGEEVTPSEVTAEELPAAFAHITFDGEDEGYTAVVQVDKATDSVNDGATYDIAPTDVTFGYADGPVGKAIYLTGKYGLDLNLEATNTDQYAVAFWMNADRLADYGATLQIGYNMGKASDVGNNVTWMNVTQSSWGADSAKIFPIVWSRNEASDAQDGTDCWPWMYGWDDSIHGKREWVHVAIVCSGEEQASPLGSTTAGAQYYINGVMVYDSQANYTNNTYFEYTWDATLAPNIMEPGDNEFESFFGINYWDTVFKGYVDDLYVFNQTLTAGQVKTLYEMGNPAVESVAPEVGEAVEEEKDPEVVACGTLVGAADFSTGFWGAHSESKAVAVGETVSTTFYVYHPAIASNWNTFAAVLKNSTATGSAEDANYVEYGVLRADNYGWDATANTGDGLATLGWTLESNWNWDTFLKDLQGAKVTVSVTNNGETADVVMDVTTAEGDAYYQKYLGVKVTGDLYFDITVDSSCIDVMKSVEITGTAVGATDCSTGWWAEFSDVTAVPSGESVTVNFTNYNNQGANWNNFIVVLQNVAAGHSAADDAAYKEYAVLRADNFGWNAIANTADLATLGWELACDWNWDTFVKDMNGAEVALTVTNNGTTADVVAVVTTVAGKTYTQSYKNIAVDGDLYFCLGVEAACLDIH